MSQIALRPERERQVEQILSRYPNRQAALIPVLHVYQDEHGWISEEIMQVVAERLGVSSAHVKGVVTFYTLFNQHPVGKHQVWVCRTLSCALRGAESVLSHCEKRLGIHPGETTKDGKITLRTASAPAHDLPSKQRPGAPLHPAGKGKQRLRKPSGVT